MHKPPTPPPGAPTRPGGGASAEGLTRRGVFLGQGHQRVAGPGLVVGQAPGGHVTQHLVGLRGLHLHGDVLQGLVVERVCAVKLDQGAGRGR